jgi:hypothetical protein
MSLSDEEDDLISNFRVSNISYSQKVGFIRDYKKSFSEWLNTLFGLEIKDDVFNIYGVVFKNEYSINKDLKKIFLKTSLISKDINNFFSEIQITESLIESERSYVKHFAEILLFLKKKHPDRFPI